MPSRILVVDDSPPIRTFVRMVLEGAGYLVFEAADAASAMLSLEGVDLALVDVQLGKDSGIELAARLPGNPVILISGHDLPLAGCLKKPFSPDQLLQAVRAALEPRP